VKRYAFAFGAALSWGVAPVLAKLGMASSGISPLLTTALAALFAIPPFYVLTTLLARGSWKVERGVVPLMVGSGVLNTLGTLFLFAALTLSSVSAVSISIGSGTPLLSLVLARLFLKRESITLTLVAGMSLVIFGIYLVVG
jgi:uncharacterized membrane protein